MVHYEFLVARLPPVPPINICQDVSLSEGEVPLSPGDARWKTFNERLLQKDNCKTIELYPVIMLIFYLVKLAREESSQVMILFYCSHLSVYFFFFLTF